MNVLIVTFRLESIVAQDAADANLVTQSGTPHEKVAYPNVTGKNQKGARVSCN
jgi:hypothetical protein